VTLAVFAFNQQEFIEEAVQAALSQTYCPLQIILSDDFSSDRTFEIMAACVARYSGCHEVVLNRNERNLGIGEHINTITSRADGVLVIGAAGDDVSLPQRVEKLVELWFQDGCRADSLCSDSYVIDADGAPLGILIGKPFCGPLVEGVVNYFPGLQGATHAWTKRPFEKFGRLLPGTVCEDRIIPFRSHVLGGVAYTNKALVKYRVHTKNVSHHHYVTEEFVISRTAELHRRNSNISLSYVHDIDRALVLGVGDAVDLLKARDLAITMHLLSKLKSEFLVAPRLRQFKLILRSVMRFPGQSLRWLIIFLFPGVYKRNQMRNWGKS
jgi:glycosyltransferase involved in cell wall biosynthesis